MLGVSEFGDEQKEYLTKTQEQLRRIRRKYVKFFCLQSAGGAYGAEYAVPQLMGTWEALSLGHRWSRK